MEILKRFQRYTLKAPTIILNPNDPPQPSKMVEDPEGEYMLVDQLKGAIKVDGLLVNCPELQEIFADGRAHQALTRDLTKLGYESFEQVVKTLTDIRDAVLPEREFEIWTEGYRATGEDAKAVLHGKVTARSFHDAIEKYVSSLVKHSADYWNYNEKTGQWSMYGCGVYDNETEARKFNG